MTRHVGYNVPMCFGTVTPEYVHCTVAFGTTGVDRYSGLFSCYSLGGGTNRAGYTLALATRPCRFVGNWVNQLILI